MSGYYNRQAESLKEKGNAHFKSGEYEEAARLYSLAIQQNSTNPLLYTNRANARIKLRQWEDVIDDCIHSIELLKENMKAYYFLGQAQLELNHPNEALASALTAYDLCSRSNTLTTSAFQIAAFVRKCKIAKWTLRERERLRQRSALLDDIVSSLERQRNQEMQEMMESAEGGAIGSVGLREELDSIRHSWDEKINEVKNAFAIADPLHLSKREVPEYLIDDISFEIMHDPVMTKHGHSYERATIIETLKRNPVDPLTREPLKLSDLRPNLALRKACDEFWENNGGWAYEW